MNHTMEHPGTFIHRFFQKRLLPSVWVLVAVVGISSASSQTAGLKRHLFTIDATRQAAAPETGYLEMGSANAGRSPDGSTLTLNSRYLVRDGKPWLPVMGEFHFSRYPKEYWEDEILKMKAGGVQIVATYIFWIHHEEREGTFDWSGQRDLRAFVALCGRHGLCVFPRIGPWAHGEVRNGGFPDWVVAKGHMRVMDSTFLSYVKTFYGEIGKQLKGLLWKDGGPVIGVQIENEYADRSPNAGEAYLLRLKEMALRAGLDVPLYTITGWDNAVIPPRAFVPVYGGYPDEPWSGSLRELAPDPQGVFQFHVGSPVGTAGILQGNVTPAEEVTQSHYPRLTAELGGGMEDTYHRRVVVSPDDIASMSLSALGSGVNMLGYYMFHGGTNPDGILTTLQESQSTDYPNDVPVKSYDFQAPLGEFGQMNKAFRHLKVLHQFLEDFGADLAPMTAVLPDVVPSGPRDTTTLRVSARTLGEQGFIFFNNYLRNYPLPEQPGVQVRLNLPSETLLVPPEPIAVPSQSSFFWPINFPMNGALLKYATAQPVGRVSDLSSTTYIFMACPDNVADFEFDASTVKSLQAQTGTVSRGKGRIRVRRVLPSTTEAIRITTRQGGVVRIVYLSQREAFNSWKVRFDGQEHLLVMSADVFAANDRIVLRLQDSKAFDFLLYPKVNGKFASNVSVRLTGRDGMFERYAASVKPITIAAGLEHVRKPGKVHPVKMGPFISWRNCAVASSPDDSTFENAGRWRVTLPKRMPPGLSDLFLRIAYAGDVARIYDGKRLIDDNFYNGIPWEIGLKRFGREGLPGEIALSVLPLRKDAPVYLPKAMWPSFPESGQIAEVRSVRIIPEYEVVLSRAGKTSSPGSNVLLGADISFLAAPGRGRYAQMPSYRDHGMPSDELTILSKHGWKAYRLRVFVSPVRNAPDNSLANTIPLARRIKASGGLFSLDFHFSDTWADPQHQDIPIAWRGLRFKELEHRVETYAHDIIAALKNAGAMPDWVQIGNEITRGTLWPVAQVQIPGSTKYNPPEPYDEAKQWDRLTRILKAGIRGVKEAAGSTPPRIVMHIDQGGNWPVTRWFFDHLQAADVDYDIIAESFYPEWHHGTLEGLRSNMIRCANRYDKDFLVAETGYDSSRVAGNEDMVWPVTPEGRRQFIADLVNTVNSAPNGIGVQYWAPERGVWNDDGSPGPTVAVLDSLASLMRRPLSHVPSALIP